MSKPKAIQWLEEQTGETFDYRPEVRVGQERHLSVRLTGELATGPDAMAANVASPCRISSANFLGRL